MDFILNWAEQKVSQSICTWDHCFGGFVVDGDLNTTIQ